MKLLSRFAGLLLCVFAGYLFVSHVFANNSVVAESKDSVSVSTPSVKETVDSTPQALADVYESLEKISSTSFQNVVIRASRAKAVSENKTLPQDIRDFARAAYYYDTQHWDSAYAAYDVLRGKDPVLDGSVILRMARSKANVNDYEGMRAALRLGKKYEKNPSFDKVALLLRIEATMVDSTLSEKELVDSLKLFFDKYPKSEDAIGLKYRYAVYQEKYGQLKQAKRLYMQLLTSSTPYKDSAFIAIRRLRKVQGEPESLSEKIAYAKLACAKDEPTSCLVLLDSINVLDSLQVANHPETKASVSEDLKQKRLPASTLDMESRSILWERRAVALRSLGRNAEAIDQYRFLIDVVEARPSWIQSVLKLYRKDSKKYDKEIVHMDSLLQDAKQYNKENANSLWLRGFEHEQKQQYDSAIACYQTLANKRFKKNKKHQWAKFRIGFVYFKQEKWDEAVKTFIDASKEPFLWSSSGARMFLGDSYMKLGKDSLAREAYLDCIRDFPLSYYAHRSRMKLAENKLMDESQIPYAHGVSMSPEETLAWIRASQKMGAPDSSYSKGRYNRIRLLFQYGFSDEAFALYEEIRKKNAKRLDFLYEYGQLFYEMGETAAGYRLARQFQNNIDRRQLMAPPIDVLHFLFPVPFKEQVLFHSGDRIDPFFVYSVMRQESIFDFEITSPVGASGLLQIMPATGKTLAAQEGISDWFDPKLLYNPYLNIRLGIRYLVDLKAEYENDYMYVLGNYNAGPKPTKRWQAAGAGLPWDVRAEEISYWETRDYVKRVMGNYWIYQEIYDKL